MAGDYGNVIRDYVRLSTLNHRNELTSICRHSKRLLLNTAFTHVPPHTSQERTSFFRGGHGRVGEAYNST